jgi:hypothetical protein
VQSSKLFADKLPSTQRPLHIIDTQFLDGNDVLLQFSDGSSAVYEAEELEKLRPAPKSIVPGRQPGNPPVYADVA